MKRLYGFVLIQIFLYITFLIIDFSDKYYILSGRIKYTVVLLCLCYSLFPRVRKDSRDLLYLRVALAFTAISDLIILFMDEDYYIYGVLTFIVVQQLYGLRLKYRNVKERGILSNKKDAVLSWLWRFSIQIGIAGMICILLSQKLSLDRLMIITVFYFISLVYNVIYGWRTALTNRGHRSNRLFAMGLLLFLLCDINVGLFNLSNYLQLPSKTSDVIVTFSSILMWTFYAPSQVLIALSADNYSNNNKKIQKSYPRCKIM